MSLQGRLNLSYLVNSVLIHQQVDDEGISDPSKKARPQDAVDPSGVESFDDHNSKCL